MLADVGFSVQAISELLGLPPARVRAIARAFGATRRDARKWQQPEDTDCDDDRVLDSELDSQRGHVYRGGYPFPIRYAGDSVGHHGPVRLFRPSPTGDLILTEVVEVA